MTTLTKERIAEIEAGHVFYDPDCNDPAAHTGELEELCRLALLGLRVEEAPSIELRVNTPITRAWSQTGRYMPRMGKRVRLVVEDQE